LSTDITPEKRDELVAHATRFGKELGIDKVLVENELDIIIGPIESAMPLFSAASGLSPSRIGMALEIAAEK
jgi:amidase